MARPLSSLRPTARVARGATYLFAQSFSNAVLGLIYFIVLAHMFSDPADQWKMGAFALLSFILSLIPVFGTLAFPSAAIKYIAQYLAEGDSEKAKAVVARVLQIGLIASGSAFLVLFIPAEWLSSFLFGNVTNAFLIRLLAICAIFTILNTEAASFLQGMQKMRDYALTALAYTAISTLTGIYLLFLGWGLYAVVFGWLAGSVVASVAGLILTAKYLGILGKPFSIRPLLNFSLPLYFSGSISFFVSWIDQLILVSYMGLLYGSTVAQSVLGIYYVAIRASVVPGLFSSSIVTALFPQLAELHAQQGVNSLKDAFRVSTRYSIVLGFPLIVGLATLAYPVLILFAGWQYTGAAEPLIIISIGALAGSLSVAINPILMTLERTKAVSVLSIVSVVLSFFLSYFGLAVLNLGMVGTAWGKTFASIIVVGLSLYILSRYISVSIDKEALWKASAASAFMVVSILSLDYVRTLLSYGSSQFLVIRLHLLPIYVLVGGLAYFLSLSALKGIKKGDLELVEEYMPQNLKRFIAWLERFAVPN